jgi:hypothetical protein
VAVGGSVVRSWPEKCIVEISSRGEIAGTAKCDRDLTESLAWTPPKVPAPYIPPALASHTRNTEDAGVPKDSGQTPGPKLGDPGGLSLFGPAPPFPLESADSEHTYQLLRHLSDRPAMDGVEWHRKCEIVQLDHKGAVLQRLVIYESREMEYAD